MEDERFKLIPNCDKNYNIVFSRKLPLPCGGVEISDFGGGCKCCIMKRNSVLDSIGKQINEILPFRKGVK
jgi:hypothetical protein